MKDSLEVLQVQLERFVANIIGPHSSFYFCTTSKMRSGLIS